MRWPSRSTGAETICRNKVGFCSRLNTGPGAAGAIFSQANPNTVYESIFKNNMDDSMDWKWKESFIKTVTLPRQALFYFQDRVLGYPATVCKVSN